MVKRSELFAIVLSIIVIVANCACAEDTGATIDPKIQNTTNEISGAILSPFCPGRSLNDCPSSEATNLKREIYSMLEAGSTADQVYAVLFKKFGEKIRAVPKGEGIGLLAWIFPIAFFVVGMIVLITWLRRQTKASSIDDNQHQ